MESNKRKNRTSTIILIVLLVITIPLLYINYKYYNDYNKTKNKKENLYNELNKKKNEVAEENSKKDSILSELNELKDFNKKIDDTKSEVFTLAQQLEEKITNGTTKYKIAYITFDDGPYYLTYSVLKTLKENKVKATFFTIGLGKESCYDNSSEDCTKLYAEIVKGGHTIANHTYSHLIFNGLYNSVDSFMEQIKKQEENIKSRTGYTTNITRFPGGSATAGSLKNGIIEKLRENGYGWVDWTAQDGDGGALNSTETAWRNFTGSINDNIEVVLFHDYSSITLSILPDAIKYLQDNNYILLPLFYESVKINK